MAKNKYSRKRIKAMMKEDEFASTMDKVVHWGKEHKGTVIAGTVALLLVVSVYVVATSYAAATRNRSENALAQAMEILYYQPKKGETPKYKDRKAQLEAARKELEHVLTLNPTTSVRQRARLYHADVLMKLKEDSEAMKELDELYNESKPPFKTIVALKYEGLLKSHGDLKKAIQVLDGVSRLDLESGLLVDYVLLSKGQLEKEAGKLEDARATFNRLVETFPESRFVTDAKNELEKIKS